jgi:DNA adenine methylase
MSNVTCECGTEFENVVRGQVKLYCSDRCRQRAKRSRDKSDKVVTLPVSVGPMKPILKYPGSKWQLSQWIASHLPEHKIYVEPFFGSGAVFFNKTPAEYEVINDLDSQVVNLFKVMRNQWQDLCDLIEMTPYAREEYYAALDYMPTGETVEDARQFLVRCWMAHGAKTSDRTGWMNRGAKAGSSTTSRWNKLPDRIRRVVFRLKSPEIENIPALELLDRFKNATDCLVYCDPPYVLETRNKRRMYKHEMTDQDHIDLLNALDRHAGPVVLSGYAHPLYDERLAHWQRITASALAEKGQSRTEVLWLNKKAQRRQMSLFEEAM